MSIREASEQWNFRRLSDRAPVSRLLGTEDDLMQGIALGQVLTGWIDAFVVTVKKYARGWRRIPAIRAFQRTAAEME
jgi:hypothetical protein